MADLNEALVEEVALALARQEYPNGTARDIDDMAEGFIEDARAIIPIVQKACEAEIVAWLREKGLTGMVTRIDLYCADAIERGEHRKGAG